MTEPDTWIETGAEIMADSYEGNDLCASSDLSGASEPSERFGGFVVRAPIR